MRSHNQDGKVLDRKRANNQMHLSAFGACMRVKNQPDEVHIEAHYTRGEKLEGVGQNESAARLTKTPCLAFCERKSPWLNLFILNGPT